MVSFSYHDKIELKKVGKEDIQLKKPNLYMSISLIAVLILLLTWLIFGFVKFLVVLFFMVVILYISFYVKKKFFKKRKKDLIIENFEYELLKIEYFIPSQRFYSSDLSNLIALDEQTESICIIERKTIVRKNKKIRIQNKKEDVFNFVVLSYKDLLQSEILEDKRVITTTVRGSQVGGTLVSGLLADGMGSVIGGLSSNSSEKSEVKNIQLKLVVNDTNKPIYLIQFLKEQEPINKNNNKYEMAVDQVNHWHGIISVLIKRADENSRQVNYFFGVQHRDVHGIN
ncbi:MAG TPA: hypothetical protein DDY49_10940 [Paenibacillaceae bacterium]|nr:hypothetical protein [Paenibacillaceae bacterium]